jgi:hypothetical protein
LLAYALIGQAQAERPRLTFERDKAIFRFAPAIKQCSGETEYEMETFGFDSTLNLIKLRSLLEFPLDAVLLGGEASIELHSKGKRNWTFELGIFTNLNDPGSVMKDYDWYKGPTAVGYFDGKFSYTESKAEMTYTLFTAKGEKRIASSEKFALYGYVGYRYQKISQDIIGYDGWQIDIFEDPSFTKVYGSDDTVKALLYEVTYKGPLFGMEYDFYFTPTISAGIEAAAIPTSVFDYDNHLLRNKDGKADGTGVGFLSSVFMHLELWRIGQSGHISFDIEGELFTARVSTKQVQEWYGDDGFTEGDDTGIIIRNIPHDVRSTQFNLGLKLGVAF